MRLRFLYLPIVLALACRAPAQTTASTVVSTRAEVDALHSAMVAALKRDPASVARFYADDASILGGGQRSVGREQIDQYWRQATMFVDWTLETLEVGGDPGAPWVRGRSTLVGQSGRRMVTDYLAVLKRQSDGQLKYYIDMYVGQPGMARAPGSGQ